MKKLVVIIYLAVVFTGCKTSNNSAQIKKWKAEVASTEKAFAEMAASNGIAEAFIAFAADSAVIMRNHKIYKGRKAIQDYFNTHDYSKVKLQWEPDFVEVSLGGDLAYTYGKYTFSMADSTGKLQNSAGIFHTVWKRQTDGNWKFVWD